VPLAGLSKRERRELERQKRMAAAAKRAARRRDKKARRAERLKAEQEERRKAQLEAAARAEAERTARERERNERRASRDDNDEAEPPSSTSTPVPAKPPIERRHERSAAKGPRFTPAPRKRREANVGPPSKRRLGGASPALIFALVMGTVLVVFWLAYRK
jgi:hypothetical protein